MSKNKTGLEYIVKKDFKFTKKKKKDFLSVPHLLCCGYSSFSSRLMAKNLNSDLHTA